MSVRARPPSNANQNLQTMLRVWTLQTAVLASAALLVFWGFYALDFLALPEAERSGAGPIGEYFAYDPDGLSDAIASLAAVNAAIFGIVITVVSIIVQLSSERYTGVARMFLRDRINLQVAAYYVVACVVSVWLSTTLRSAYVPEATLTAMLSVTTGGIVVMAPYFGYVFWFLEPQNIIARIRREAVRAAEHGAAGEGDAACAIAQGEALFALKELTDIANNSISGRDKIIASAAVDALKDVALGCITLKPQASPHWFKIGPKIRLNPDFVAMDPESLADLEARRTWLEWQVMRQFLGVYNDALGSMRDICNLIAIDTRYIGEAAVKAGDDELITLVLRYMNSYLRSTLNAKDVRTAYNVLNQYRKLVEALLVEGRHSAALEAVRHIKYYGLIGYDMHLNFVTETVAFDLAAIAQLASEVSSPVESLMLQEFLELDRPTNSRAREKALVGARKAQVKLAVYYLSAGQEARARAIAADMREEPADRIDSIRAQLESVETKDFWEIIDRGRNLEYMPPEQRALLPRFFALLDEPQAR